MQTDLATSPTTEATALGFLVDSLTTSQAGQRRKKAVPRRSIDPALFAAIQEHLDVSASNTSSSSSSGPPVPESVEEDVSPASSQTAA